MPTNLKPRILQVPLQEVMTLRHEVLWPDQPRLFSSVDGDDGAFHFGIVLDHCDGQLAGAASLFANGDICQLRKFAIRPTFQRQRLGSVLLEHIILFAKNHRFLTMFCDARTTATGFYEKHGMTLSGDMFVKHGECYRRMCLKL